MKGLFIPDITSEMFRNGCLEGIDALMAEGEIYDIECDPSAQPERLTDKEQRIFLVAMGREEKVCKEVDRKYPGEPYEDSLVRVCREIERKVKGALWT